MCDIPRVFHGAPEFSDGWCLLFVLIRQGLRGGSGPLRLIRAPGIETGNPIMTFEQRSSFIPSFGAEKYGKGGT